MKISYKKLWILLIEKEISPAKLRKDCAIATGTCKYLDCNIGDVCEFIKDNNAF